MHDHEIERHGQRGLEAVHDHAERIAHENEIHIAVGDNGGVGVIGGQSDDGRAALAGKNFRCGDPAR
jgi:hypothetical protein